MMARQEGFMRQCLGYATAQVFASLARGNVFGLDIMRETGLPSGTVYPTLTRAEAAGFVRGRWESTAEAARQRRPRRRYYTLTAAGKAALELAMTRFGAFAAGGRLRSEP
jgi:DNA-binding PadR family transcriptional regulator